MNKVLYNASYGGYGYNDAFIEAWLNHKGIAFEKKSEGTFFTWYKEPNGENRLDVPTSRHHPEFVAFVEAYYAQGLDPSGRFASIGIEEIEGDKYIIEEYDGMESVLTPDDMGWTTIQSPTDKPISNSHSMLDAILKAEQCLYDLRHTQSEAMSVVLHSALADAEVAIQNLLRLIEAMERHDEIHTEKH